MKKVCLLWMILSVLLSVMPAAATEEAAATYGNTSCYSLDAVNTILGNEELVENAKSIIVYEKNSNTLMYAWNADAQIYPASLVKIMTGLITVQRGNMEEAVTVKGSVLSSIPSDAATIGLQPDEVMTVEDLLYCMMVGSANDAAAVLADHIAGSQEAFIAEMNTYAAELGCTGTNFTNVHGLHDEAQYTTVRDVAKIISAALEHSLFRTVFGTEMYTVDTTNKSEARHLLTGNYLMSMEDVEYYYDSRVTGGRTGVTTDGFRNISVCAQSGTMELICVLSGAEDTLAENGYSVEVFGGYDEVSDLLDKGFKNYQVAQVVYDDQILTQMPVQNGDCDVVLCPSANVVAILPADARAADLSYRFPAASSALNAPIKKGDIVSSVEIWYNATCVAQTELYAMNDVDLRQISTDTGEQDTQKRESNGFWIVLLIIAGAVVLLITLRTINKVRYRAASRRNRRNRRRSR